MNKLRFNKLSAVKCKHPNCGRFIKQRHIDRENPYTLCYRHYCEEQAKSGNMIGHLGKPRKDRLNVGMSVKSYNEKKA